MDNDLNYSLHYQRWHRIDEAYFRDWHESDGASLVGPVAKDKSGGILDIGRGFGLSVCYTKSTAAATPFPASGAAAVGHVRVRSRP